MADKKQELVERYGRLATQAGDLNYRVYVINKEMEDIQRQHAAIVAAEPKQEEKKDETTEAPAQVESTSPAADPS